MIYAPSTIDLSRVPVPKVIEELDHETLYQAFVARFLAAWQEERALDPTLPLYNVEKLESDPAGIAGEAWSFLRFLDRQRVNDVIKSILAPLATGTDLDAIAASRNVIRQEVKAATDDAPAVMQSDAELLRDYLLSFDKAAAGSRDRYLYEAWRAWPGMLDARVNGFDVHGRRGDTDVVIIGPNGEPATAAQKAVVSSAVRAPHVKPEAVSVAVLDAVRLEYDAAFMIEVPPGPDPELVRVEAVSRVRKAAQNRMLIGGRIPAGYLMGACYGESIIAVRDLAPVTVEAEAYTIPILRNLTIALEAAG